MIFRVLMLKTALLTRPFGKRPSIEDAVVGTLLECDADEPGIRRRLCDLGTSIYDTNGALYGCSDFCNRQQSHTHPAGDGWTVSGNEIVWNNTHDSRIATL